MPKKKSTKKGYATAYASDSTEGREDSDFMSTNEGSESYITRNEQIYLSLQKQKEKEERRKEKERLKQRKQEEVQTTIQDTQTEQVEDQLKEQQVQDRDSTEQNMMETPSRPTEEVPTTTIQRKQDHADIMGDERVQGALTRMSNIRASPTLKASLRGSDEVNLVMASKNAILAIVRACTRIPSKTKEEIDRALLHIEEATISLEAKLNYTTAERDILQSCQTARQESSNMTQQTTERPERPETKRYADAVKEATTTLILKPTEDRTPAQLREQLQSAPLSPGVHLKNVQTLRTAVKIQLNTVEDLNRVKKKLSEDRTLSKMVEFQQTNVRRKKIILMHVPKTYSKDYVSTAIHKAMGTDGKTEEEKKELLQYGYAKETGTDTPTFHVPIIIPSPLADTLLSKGSIMIGFKRCPVKKYIAVIRCRKCQFYGHTAQYCVNETRCENCAGKHSTEECREREVRCQGCSAFNYFTRQQRSTPVDVRHKANSPECHIYRTIFTIRRIEAEKNLQAVQDWDIIQGKVTVQSVNGRQVIARNHQEEDIRPLNRNQNRRR